MEFTSIVIWSILGLQYLDIVRSLQCFPKGFLLGTATASYQVEGGWNETGREPSIWDVFCRERPGVECANVADDFLHRYKEDIKLMSSMGLTSFRFSISWSRVMKWDHERQELVKNQPGLAFYHQLIKELRDKKIEPILTMYHWDLPYALQEHLDPPGWLNSTIAQHFLKYADILFREYGKSVLLWSTFNEPHSFVTSGYSSGVEAPGYHGTGNYEYIAAHNVLRSHAFVVKLFRELKHQGILSSKGKIGIVLNCDYSIPLNAGDSKDVESAERYMQFMLGWYLSPITTGKYPQVMRNIVKERLPTFTKEESVLLRRSYDIFMLNHYSSHVVTPCTSHESSTTCDSLSIGYNRDLGLDTSRFPNGSKLSSTTNGRRNCGWFSGYPEGYLPTIEWMHKHDTSAEILLTENGWCGNATIENYDQLWYYQTYVQQVFKALQRGIPIIGYTAWSLLDNYEWGSFTPRFGLFFVKYNNLTGSKEGYNPKKGDLVRIARPSVNWFTKLARTNCLTDNTLFEETLEESKLRNIFFISILLTAFTLISLRMKGVVKSRRDSHLLDPLLKSEGKVPCYSEVIYES